MDNLIFRIDIIAVDGRKRFLLVKRPDQRDQWTFPGGRVQKDEPVHEASVRKLKEETGLEGAFIRQIGFYEYVDDNSFLEGAAARTPVVVSLVNIEGDKELVVPEEEIENYAWADSIPADLHPHQQDMLRRAGFSSSF